MTTQSNTFGRRYFRNRKIAQILTSLFWISLPLSGLLQVDIRHLALVVAGRPWPPRVILPADALKRGASAHWDVVAPVLLQGVLPVAIFVIAVIVTARLFGRVHCGYSCTYGLLAETGEAMFRWAKKPGPGRAMRLALVWLWVVSAAPLVAFTILSLFVRPEGVIEAFRTHNLGIIVPFSYLTVLAAIVGGFVRLHFCRYVCGVGLIQTLSWMTNKKALEVGFNPTAAADGSHGSMRDCTGCHECKNVCPIGFDPRQPKRYMMACFQCGECLKACEDELHPLGRGIALGFHFQEPDYPLPAQEVKPTPRHVD
ncbi:MAG TPA: 4Fe-4S dicluster domain-containing protein [Pantanalinema sp.]